MIAMSKTTASLSQSTRKVVSLAAGRTLPELKTSQKDDTPTLANTTTNNIAQDEKNTSHERKYESDEPLRVKLNGCDHLVDTKKGAK